MTRDDSLDISRMLTEVGVDANTADPSVSVGDSSILRSERSVEMIPQYQPAATEITIGAKIGEGTLSEVFLGEQRSMRRKVAVRKVHSIRRTTAAPGYLLSEAWMLGAFEHPNILPVYLVSKDEDGLPIVVMKAIETVPWTEVLETSEHPLGCPSHADPLVFNVRRLLGVCNALEHAHHRGCIHRDIKPDNVLIGRDGTLYLHGWELAVSLEEDPSGRFPCAADQTQIAGTPSYMAPELATLSLGQLGPATDVYLVGATLHEVVTGQPRHVGQNVFDAFYSAVASAPYEYGPGVPHELAAIMNKAMAVQPADRFQSVTELRHALEGFIRHRPSERLTELAIAAHDEFSGALAGQADGDVVRELFAGASNAYGSARHFWPRNPVVTASLDRLIRDMIVYEVDNGAPQRAERLLQRLHTPAPDLEGRISEANEVPTIRQIRPPTITFEQPLQEGERDRRSRATFMGAMVAVWSAFGFAFGAMESFAGVTVTIPMLGVVAAFAWLALGGIVALQSRSLFKTLSTRNVLAPIAVIIAGTAAILLTSVDQTPHQIIVAHLLIFFIAMGMLNAYSDWRLIVASITYFLAFVIGSHAPEYAFWIMGISNLIGLGSAGLLIHRRLSQSSP